MFELSPSAPTTMVWPEIATALMPTEISFACVQPPRISGATERDTWAAGGDTLWTLAAEVLAAAWAEGVVAARATAPIIPTMRVMTPRGRLARLEIDRLTWFFIRSALPRGAILYVWASHISPQNGSADETFGTTPAARLDSNPGPERHQPVLILREFPSVSR
jgi:hypothetical protein